jgi:hypothetical protein
MKVFILASGSQKRWNRSKPEYPIKQLVPIEGVPLIYRTINQLFSRGIVPTVVSKIDELNIGDRIIPEDSRFAVSSLHSTMPQWGAENLVLLGDVYFTDKAIDMCLNMDGDIHFAGLPREIFAVYWRDVDKMDRLLRETTLYGEKGTRYAGKLWTLYRSFIGVDLEKHIHNMNHYTFIKDGSRDFDKWSEYEAFCNP